MSGMRRRLNDWAAGPRTPNHDFSDLYYFVTYIKRSAIIVTFVGYVACLGTAALLPYLFWNLPAQRIIVGLTATAHWPAAWWFYMRHHYKPEFADG